MSMQMDAYLKKEQIGTLFVRVGALGDGYWGGDGGRGPPSQKIGLTSITFFLAPPAQVLKIFSSGHTEIFNLFFISGIVFSSVRTPFPLPLRCLGL